MNKYKTLFKWEGEFSDIPDDYLNNLYGRFYGTDCPRWKQKSRQETFDTCAKHMLKQRRRSGKRGFGNLYAGPWGLKCPVRVLIPLSLWNKEIMEYTSCDAGPVFRALTKAGFDAFFCKEFQKIHDNCKPSQWAQELNRLAMRFGLKGVRKEWMKKPKKKTNEQDGGH